MTQAWIMKDPDGTANQDLIALSGMEKLESVARELRRLFGQEQMYRDERGRRGFNDAITALIHGPRQAISDLCSMLNNTALVSALLLTWAMPMLIQLPDTVAALESDNARRIIFVVAFTLCSIACATNIIFAIIYNNAKVRAIRDSDCWRLALNLLPGNTDEHPDVRLKIPPADVATKTMYLAVISAMIGVGMGAAANLDWAQGMLILGSSVLCMALIFLYAMILLKPGHVNFYWQMQGHLYEDPVNLIAALDHLDNQITRSKAWTKEMRDKLNAIPDSEGICG